MSRIPLINIFSAGGLQGIEKLTTEFIHFWHWLRDSNPYLLTFPLRRIRSPRRAAGATGAKKRQINTPSWVKGGRGLYKIAN